MEVHHQRRPLRASIHPWRPFSPDSHRAHGHWVSNARNALDSGRTGERGGGQHPTPSSRSRRGAECSVYAPKQSRVAERRLSFAAHQRPATVKFSDKPPARSPIEGLRRHPAISRCTRPAAVRRAEDLCGEPMAVGDPEDPYTHPSRHPRSLPRNQPYAAHLTCTVGKAQTTTSRQ
jgi:hypothetical protein